MSVLENALSQRTTSAGAKPVKIPGQSHPLGATVMPGGVNFSLFSRGATAVDLLLFDREMDARPPRGVRLDPVLNPPYHYWHVFVPGLQPWQIYGYRVDGKLDPAMGHRFDPLK